MALGKAASQCGDDSFCKLTPKAGNEAWYSITQRWSGHESIEPSGEGSPPPTGHCEKTQSLKTAAAKLLKEQVPGLGTVDFEGQPRVVSDGVYELYELRATAQNKAYLVAFDLAGTPVDVVQHGDLTKTPVDVVFRGLHGRIYTTADKEKHAKLVSVSKPEWGEAAGEVTAPAGRIRILGRLADDSACREETCRGNTVVSSQCPVCDDDANVKATREALTTSVPDASFVAVYLHTTPRRTFEFLVSMPPGKELDVVSAVEKLEPVLETGLP